MGAKLCSLCKPKCLNTPENQRTSRRRRRRRCIENPTTQMEKKAMIIKTKKLTLEDWLLASPASFKTDYLKRGEYCSFRNSKKKIHPSSSSSSISASFATTHVARRSISEARDSLCLDRPMSNREDEEGVGKSETLGLSGKTDKKRVSFKLPHDLILYSPEKEEENYGYEWDNSEDSFYSPIMDGNCREGPVESPEEICVRLAVDTLPRVSVSSTF